MTPESENPKGGASLLQTAGPVLGILCMAGSFVRAFMTGGFSDPGAVALGVPGLLLFLTMFIRTGAANLRQYLHVGFYTAMAVGSAALVYLFLLRHNREFDLTPGRLHTLTEATVNNLRMLTRDVDVVVFDVQSHSYRPMLERYASASPRVRWMTVDPLADPLFTRQYGDFVDAGTIFVQHGTKRKMLTSKELTEKNLTNAIVEVTRDGAARICFLRGHGEMSLSRSGGSQNQEERSAALFAESLLAQGMRAEPLDLVDRGFIPRDTSLLVILSPRRDLFQIEARQIREWLVGGGKLLVFFDLPRSGETGQGFPNLASLLRRYGIDDQEEIIIDLNGDRLAGDPMRIPMVWYNPEHPITQGLQADKMDVIAVPLVRGLKALAPPDKVELLPIVGSSTDAWTAPFYMALSGQLQPPRQMGTQAIGWSAEEELALPGGPGHARVVVFGSGDLVEDRSFATQNTSAALLLRSVNWLLGQEEQVFVPERVIEGTPLILEDARLRFILIAIVMAFPSLLFFGGVTWVGLIRRG